MAEKKQKNAGGEAATGKAASSSDEKKSHTSGGSAEATGASGQKKTKGGKQQQQDTTTPAAVPKQVAKQEKIDETLRYIVRIGGTDIDGRKPIRSALPKVRGVGINFSNAIIKAMHLDGGKKLGKFTEEEMTSVEQAIKKPEALGIPTFMFNRRRDFETGTDMHATSADLEVAFKRDVEFLKKIKSYRGIRHFYGLKLRGQRTASRGAGMHGRSGKTIGVLRTKLMAQAKEQAATAGDKGGKSKAPAAKKEEKK